MGNVNRHCGLDPQSRGATGVASVIPATLTVILALRQYPQGGVWMFMRIRIFRIMGIFRIVTMLGHRFHPLLPCQALGQALVLSHQGRGVYGWCCLVVNLRPSPLWIADQVRNDGLVFTLCSRVKHWDRLWSSSIKGEGDDGWS